MNIGDYYMTMLKPKDMAERLGVTVRTLQRWDNEGILKAQRTPTNRRYYTEEQYLDYIGQHKENKRKYVAYARVSTYGQKDDLKNQVEFLRQYANAKGIILDESITDVDISKRMMKKSRSKEILNTALNIMNIFVINVVRLWIVMKMRFKIF